MNVLLTLARAWTTLETGTFWPKHVAADWAMPRLPPEQRAVLADARAVYLGQAPDEWNGRAREIHAHVAAVLAGIRRAAGGSPPAAARGGAIHQRSERAGDVRR